MTTKTKTITTHHKMNNDRGIDQRPLLGTSSNDIDTNDASIIVLDEENERSNGNQSLHLGNASLANENASNGNGHSTNDTTISNGNQGRSNPLATDAADGLRKRKNIEEEKLLDEKIKSIGSFLEKDSDPEPEKYKGVVSFRRIIALGWNERYLLAVSLYLFYFSFLLMDQLIEIHC